MASYSFLEKSPFERMAKFKDALDTASAELATMSPALKRAQQWDPYGKGQGGTNAALAGDDFVVVASDTRMSGEAGIEILTRNCEKIHVLNNKIILNTCGYYGDVLQLKRMLQVRLDHYEFVYQHEMGVDLCAEMLARSLYYRRFFPYYTGAILAGLDDDGKGAVFSYDPVGCIERLPSSTGGSGGHIVQSFFDNQWTYETMEPEVRARQPARTLERALTLMRDAYRGLAERETTTGDSVKLAWLKAGDDKVHQEVIPLRED